MSFTAKADLPLPNVPAHLIEQAIGISNDNTAIAIYRETEEPGKFCLRHSSKELLNWVHENISDRIKTVWVQTIKGGNFGPHIDGPGRTSGSRRYFNLMYIIDPGGDNVLTHFYKPIDSNIGDKTVFSNDEVVLKETFHYKPNTWNLMTNQEIHSVEGVTGTRLGLSISFYNPDLPQKFKDLIS